MTQICFIENHVDEAQEALQELESELRFVWWSSTSLGSLVVGRIQAFLIMMDHWEFDSQISWPDSDVSSCFLRCGLLRSQPN